MKVRFKEISKHYPYRISYQVENEVPEPGYDELQEKYCMGYYTKELGFIAVELLEITEDETDIDAIDVIVKLNQD